MKQLMHQVLQAFGVDLVRYRRSEEDAAAKTVRSETLALHSTRTGRFFLPKDAQGDRIAAAIRAGEIFDASIYQVASQYIKPETAVLDVGSNFGQMAVLFSRLVGERGLVYAFEADDFVFSLLEKNCPLNAQNIVTRFGAVHDQGDQTLFFPVQDFKRFGTYGSYGIDYVHGTGRPVKSVVIDDLDFRLPISFMKIDVQGGDLFAMKGARATISKHKMPIIFEYEYLFEEELNLNFQEYVDFVQEIGYKFSRVIDGHNFLILPRGAD